MTRRHLRLSTALMLAPLLLLACRHTVDVTPGAPQVTAVIGVGFDAPENLVYDSVADVFLVSNMVGDGSTRDGRAFISRVAPDGRVLALRWIDSGMNGVTLDAPKGLAIRGDTLAVADLGVVRLFDRHTGAPIRTISLPGLVMNDVAWGEDGSLWITDTGPDRSHGAPDTSRDEDAVWRVTRDGRVHAVARGLSLDRPDGIVLDNDGAIIATFGASRLEHVREGTAGATLVRRLPGGRVDGLRRSHDGALLATSWNASAVWRLMPDEPPRVLLRGVVSPAGLAVDTRRDRLAVTSMRGNVLYLLPLR